MATRGELKEHALHAFLAGDLGRALKVYAHLLAKAPADYDARLKIADVLAAAGHKAEAAAVYRATAWFDIKSGHPLPAVVAARALTALGENADDLLTAIAVFYGRTSDRLNKHAPRLAPEDPDEDVGVPPLGGIERVAALPASWVQDAARLATSDAALAGLPEQVRPVPLFSDLTEEAFRRVLALMTVHRLPDKQVVLREGEIGRSFFLVAGGKIQVFNMDSIGQRADLAELNEGTIFGEMALLSAAPRTASAEVKGEADLLELGRDALASLAGEMSVVATALDAFTRERLLRNLLATSPIFKPFTRQEQQDLLRRFTQHDCAAGTVLIREGDEGRGLYVVLSGELEVGKKDGAREVPLAVLKPGAVCGEIALLRGGATTATVRAARPSTVLYLDRAYFQRLVDAVPELRALFENISSERLVDMDMTLSRTDTDEDAEELSEDDLVML